MGTKCTPHTPKHMLLSRGKWILQMGGEMLNFPADDLAVLFTPHLWPSVTFHTAAASTWPVCSGCEGIVAGLKDRNSVLSYQLECGVHFPVLGQTLSEVPWEIGAQWGTDPALSCPKGQKGFGSLQSASDSPKPPANFLFSHLAPSFPIGTSSQNKEAPHTC